jgi:tRNA modification GTPase
VPEPQTIVACLTPSGTGAIATLAVRGPRAWPVVRSLFRRASAKPLPEELPRAGVVWFGHFGDERMADEVVLSVKQVAPTPWLEIHCHGGRQAVGWLMEALLRHGIEARSWQEFVRDIEPPIRAAALEELARAKTARAAAILLDQYHGALEAALVELRGHLQAHATTEARGKIGELLRFAALGRRLTQPWHVVVAGAPNVGKSSLVNALAGHQRSVVAAVPGTTRDVVTIVLAIDGWPVELADTAGLRQSGSGLERAGIGLAQTALAEADLCLWLVDATAEPVWPEAALGSRSSSTLLVVNKIDQPMAWNRTDAGDALFVSALTASGIPELCAEISRRLVPCVPSPGSPVPFLSSLIDDLHSAHERIDAVMFEAALELLRRWA